ncbi:hypothetical protein CAJAP_10700 [Camponotus japonicus]
MEKPTWTVVQFSTDNTVEAVPSSWIEHNKCYWPPFKYEQIITAIRKNMQRNTCWPCYDIITFRNSTYDDYNVARLKTKKAEYTSASDLNSEIESTKRKRIINRLYVASDSDDDCDKNNNSTKQKQIKENEMVKKKTKRAIYSEDSEESNSILPKHPQMTESMKINSNASGFKATKQTFNTRDSLNSNIDTSLNNAPHSFTRDDDNTKYFKEIIRQQSFFKTQLWQMADDLREIKDIVTGNLMQQNKDVHKQNEKSIYFSFDLPLKTVEEIEGAVEEFLKISENFERSTMETRIVGGTSPYNFIKRNLSQLITNELAVQYSWLGAKFKRQFSNLRIADMLLAAGTAYCDSYTKLELEKAIQKWLRRTKERCDARKKTETCENN